jgi:hypothetical protein
METEARGRYLDRIEFRSGGVFETLGITRRERYFEPGVQAYHDFSQAAVIMGTYGPGKRRRWHEIIVA